jgi:hypothetical protein
MKGVMNQHAQELFCTLRKRFTSRHQKANFTAMLALFLKGDGFPYLRHSTSKSPAALSRFLNHYAWNARAIIRTVRQHAMKSLFAYYQQQRGRRPRLLVMLDLTTLEKTGRFERLGLVRVLKRGLHVVVMYLVAGRLRFPWAFQIWRGKGEASASELALKLLRHVPPSLLSRFRVLVLADGGFGNVAFLEGVQKLGLDAVVGMRSDRCLEDGRHLGDVPSGERVTPTGLSFPITVARYHLKRSGKRETRVVVATFAATGRVISRWGKRRWRIEAFFKVAKGRFGLARFGQQTLLGVFRFLVLSLLAFVLSQWEVWSLPQWEWPDWRGVAMEVRRLLVPEVVQAELLEQLERLRPYLEAK